MEDITFRLKLDQDRENQQRQLMQADKMISLGILVSGVAHEINNPNQFVVSHIIPIEKAFMDALPVLDRYYDDYGDFKIGGLPYKKTRERLPKMFENIKEGTKRIANIVNDLREYAKEQPVDHSEAVDINKVVKAALVLLHNLIRKCTSGFYVNYGKNIPEVIADFQKIEQVVINLVQNACQSSGDKPLEISITTFLSDKKDEVCIQVNDTGKGISKDNIERVTDPFFTTKRGEGGTGLGLSISNSICAAFGGRLEFLSEEGEGTTARVWLPAKIKNIG
jgi:signal transduction histidine kinase